MKRGEVFKKPGFRWMEPQHPILGDKYYTHVWGSAYAVSGRAASFLSSIPEGSLRFLNNEGVLKALVLLSGDVVCVDTTVGAWMLAFNVTYLDDRRFCTTNCTDASLVIFDFPKCPGLCNPQERFLELHKDPQCRAHPDAIAELPEIVRVNTARSRQLPPKINYEEVAL